MQVCHRIVFLAFTATLLATTVRAENIDLSTVPSRDSVQLTIYNSEDITLVRETRKVTFKKGVNPLQFSWANTLIDPTSVELKFLTQADKLEVLDTTFPHDKPQMLYWNVQSEFDGEATIQITYFTSGITWTRRLHRHRRCRREEREARGLRPRPQQQRRRIRGRPSAAGSGHDQPGREDRAAGEYHSRGRVCE